MKKYDVFGLGNALMDTLVHVEESDLEDLKLQKGTMQLVEGPYINFLLSFLHKRNVTHQAGGSVSNTMAGVALLGGKSFFNGRIARDKVGFEYEHIMNEQGVETDLAKDDEQTGQVISLVTKDGERTMTAYLGSAVHMTKSNVNVKAIAQSKILHLEAYMLEGPLKEITLHAMNIAKKNNVIISIDLSDPELIKRNLAEFKKIVKKYVDVVFMNETEAEVFTNTNNMHHAIDLISPGVRLAIVKLGEKGSLIKIKGRTLVIDPVKPRKVVDTTGAGDMYAAGILYGIAKGLSLEESGKIASLTATKVVEQMGARLPRKPDFSYV